MQRVFTEHDLVLRFIASGDEVWIHVSRGAEQKHVRWSGDPANEVAAIAGEAREIITRGAAHADRITNPEMEEKLREHARLILEALDIPEGMLVDVQWVHVDVSDLGSEVVGPGAIARDVHEVPWECFSALVPDRPTVLRVTEAHGPLAKPEAHLMARQEPVILTNEQLFQKNNFELGCLREAVRAEEDAFLSMERFVAAVSTKQVPSVVTFLHGGQNKIGERILVLPSGPKTVEKFARDLAERVSILRGLLLFVCDENPPEQDKPQPSVWLTAAREVAGCPVIAVQTPVTMSACLKFSRLYFEKLSKCGDAFVAFRTATRHFQDEGWPQWATFVCGEGRKPRERPQRREGDACLAIIGDVERGAHPDAIGALRQAIIKLVSEGRIGSLLRLGYEPAAGRVHVWNAVFADRCLFPNKASVKVLHATVPLDGALPERLTAHPALYPWSPSPNVKNPIEGDALAKVTAVVQLGGGEAAKDMLDALQRRMSVLPNRRPWIALGSTGDFAKDFAGRLLESKYGPTVSALSYDQAVALGAEPPPEDVALHLLQSIETALSLPKDFAFGIRDVDDLLRDDAAVRGKIAEQEQAHIQAMLADERAAWERKLDEERKRSEEQLADAAAQSERKARAKAWRWSAAAAGLTLAACGVLGYAHQRADDAHQRADDAHQRADDAHRRDDQAQLFDAFVTNDAFVDHVTAPGAPDARIHRDQDEIYGYLRFNSAFEMPNKNVECAARWQFDFPSPVRWRPPEKPSPDKASPDKLSPGLWHSAKLVLWSMKPSAASPRLVAGSTRGGTAEMCAYQDTDGTWRKADVDRKEADDVSTGPVSGYYLGVGGRPKTTAYGCIVLYEYTDRRSAAAHESFILAPRVESDGGFESFIGFPRGKDRFANADHYLGTRIKDPKPEHDGGRLGGNAFIWTPAGRVALTSATNASCRPGTSPESAGVRQVLAAYYERIRQAQGDCPAKCPPKLEDLGVSNHDWREVPGLPKTSSAASNDDFRDVYIVWE